MEILGDVGYVESRFGPFVYSVSAGASKLHSMPQMYRNLTIVLDIADSTPR